MPNWTTIEISTTNPNLFSQFINENGEFDFNYFIPMPEDLNIEVPVLKDDAIAYYVTERLTIPYDKTNLDELISNSFNENWSKAITEKLAEQINREPQHNTKERLDWLYNVGKQYMSNLEKYGYYDWYEWRCDNWNSKWNASSTVYDKDSPCEIYFHTPWDVPRPVFQKLCEMYPDEKIYFHCEFEFGGVEEYMNDNGNLLLAEKYELDDEYEDDDENDNGNDGDDEQFEINIIFELK